MYPSVLLNESSREGSGQEIAKSFAGKTGNVHMGKDLQSVRFLKSYKAIFHHGTG